MLDRSMRQRLRLAQALVNQIVAPPRPAFHLPRLEWTHLVDAVRRSEHCRAKDWPTARRATARAIERTVQGLSERLAAAVHAARETTAPPAVPTLRDMLADIAGLEEEFPSVGWDLRAKTLSVTTEDIVLDGITLGPFQVTLNYAAVSRQKSYRVVALEPHPAAGHERTTHPHVQNDSLCEGEGRAALRTALLQGRVFDFFVLVRQILQTYNADSAYVPLSSWEGTLCPDCGSTVRDDDLSCCDACQDDVCGLCTGACGGSRCGKTLCASCQERCETCAETYCSDCLAACNGCQQSYCPPCLTGGLCKDCQELPLDEPTSEVPEQKRSAPPARVAVSP